jgi:hypothetical protein
MCISLALANPVTAETTMDTLSVIQAATYTNLSKSSLDKLRVYGGGPLYIKAGRG